MKKKFVMLTISVLTAVMLVAGCGSEAENVAGDTAVVTETEDENTEEMSEEAETAEEDSADEEDSAVEDETAEEENEADIEDTPEADSDAVSVEETDVTEETDNAGAELTDSEYTAEIIAAAIPNNNVKMTIVTEGLEMGVAVCDQDVAITMDLGFSKMDIYSVDKMNYLHGMYEDQEVWMKASGADDLTDSYSEDTEEGMNPENIHNISDAVKENKNGKEYDVVTAEVDVDAQDGSTSVSQYKFYIDPQTQKADYMIYEQEGMTYETTIEAITEIELPEGAQSAEEVGADELAMQMLGFMFAGAGTGESE